MAWFRSKQPQLLIFDLGTAGTDFDAPTISLNDPNNDGIIDGSEYDSWVGLSWHGSG